MELPELIRDFKRRVKDMEEDRENMDDVSWGHEQGLIISGNEAKAIIDFYAKQKPVRALKDDSGHWYVVPNEMATKFYELLEGGEQTESEFIELFSKYVTGGSLNLTQLYANIK